MKAKSKLADSFITETDISECVEIGDCVRARTVEQATAEAYNAAMDL
jgi:exosome complex RNA-binding protein Csl4